MQPWIGFFMNVFQNFMVAGATNTTVALCTLESTLDVKTHDWFPFDFGVDVLLITHHSLFLVT